jgi:hypothetical protein
MPVAEALAFFSDGASRVPPPPPCCPGWPTSGSGYLRLGPAAHDAVRRRAPAAQARRRRWREGGVYVLDEPTTGPAPGRRRAAARRCSTGWSTRQSVIVIEHHQAVMAHADWIIDLGPGAGPRRRPRRVRGHPGPSSCRPRDADRGAPRGLRRRLTRQRPDPQQGVRPRVREDYLKTSLTFSPACLRLPAAWSLWPSASIGLVARGLAEVLLALAAELLRLVLQLVQSAHGEPPLPHDLSLPRVPSRDTRPVVPRWSVTPPAPPWPSPCWSRRCPAAGPNARRRGRRPRQAALVAPPSCEPGADARP